MTDQVTLREFFDEKFKRIEDLVVQKTAKLSDENVQIMEKQDITNGRVLAAERMLALADKEIARLKTGYLIAASIGAALLSALAYYVVGKLP